MKKYLITVTATCALIAPLLAQAQPSVSGFGDIRFTIDRESTNNTGGPPPGHNTKNPSNNRFSATGEIDISHTQGNVTIRTDIDLDLAANNGSSLGGDSARIEQAFFLWNISPTTNLMGGVFNDPLGADAEDVTDMAFTTHSAVYNILDHQTALDGNNIAGVGADFSPVPGATITVAALNDLGQADTTTTAAENISGAAVINLNSPLLPPPWNIELGFASQAAHHTTDNPLSAGNVADLNIIWSGICDIGIDYLKPADIVDQAITFWGKCNNIGGTPWSGGLRYDEIKWDTSNPLIPLADTIDAVTAYISYEIATNMLVALELKNTNNDPVKNAGIPNTVAGAGISNGGDLGDGRLIQAQFVTRF